MTLKLFLCVKRVVVLVVQLCSQLSEAAIYLSKGAVASHKPLSWKDISSKMFLNEHSHYPTIDGGTLSLKKKNVPRF